MADRVTIADVARYAGVSKQTVSRALNNKADISAATREYILDVMQRLGYRPSNIARGLATSRTRTIGLVVPDIANPFFPDIARGAADTARTAGYSLLLCNTTEDPSVEAEILQTLEEMRVDGLIMCSSRLPDNELAELCARYAAVVLVNRGLPGLDVGRVRVEDAEGARAAVQHLVAGGRKVIGALSGPSGSHSGQERARGFTEAMVAAGLPLYPEIIVDCPPFVEGGRDAARRVLQARPDLDALVCYNDLVGVGALQACAELGRRVPSDVAVVGNDDIMLAGMVTPSLTTLSVDKRGIGASAVQLLLAKMAGAPDAKSEVLFYPELVVRDSAP